MTELVVRLVFSLAVVLGLLLLTARLGARRFKGRAGSPVRVLHRQALSRTSSVTVVTVGSRVLVLGTTEQQVRVLAELDPHELEDLGDTGDTGSEVDLAPVAHLVSAPTTSSAGFATLLHDQLEAPAAPTPPSPGRHAAPRSHAAQRRTASRRAAPPSTTAPAEGALAGSVLSPQTWRQALQAVSGRAS
ncbi:flagellar biosynthetic protein FliO [Nocardioides sp.]|uniref:flagellar biosynthetic protein FliO n=1 Tax=Nocardioides sp. TaxID=35761 RepID=UPI00286D5D9D|nr:flagellar biosynthetic protein FliO [Nocardioides sp.]